MSAKELWVVANVTVGAYDADVVGWQVHDAAMCIKASWQGQ